MQRARLTPEAAAGAATRPRLRTHTRIELADTERGATRATGTGTHQPQGGNRLLHALRGRAMQRMVHRTVDSELTKLLEHITRMTEDHSVSVAAEPGSIAVKSDQGGWVCFLRGRVDASADKRLELQWHLEEVTVVAVDVRELTYLDATALPPLLRWARRSSQSGHRAVIRGANPALDEMLGVMGLASTFSRVD